VEKKIYAFGSILPSGTIIRKLLMSGIFYRIGTIKFTGSSLANLLIFNQKYIKK